MVTDSAVVMKKVAQASVSLEILTLDETWMVCVAHILNNVMNSANSSCNYNACLGVVCSDFRAMKRIVEDANRSGWSKCLPDG